MARQGAHSPLRAGRLREGDSDEGRATSQGTFWGKDRRDPTCEAAPRSLPASASAAPPAS